MHEQVQLLHYRYLQTKPRMWQNMLCVTYVHIKVEMAVLFLNLQW